LPAVGPNVRTSTPLKRHGGDGEREGSRDDS
jgi:hypothetical protein